MLLDTFIGVSKRWIALHLTAAHADDKTNQQPQ